MESEEAAPAETRMARSRSTVAWRRVLQGISTIIRSLTRGGGPIQGLERLADFPRALPLGWGYAVPVGLPNRAEGIRWTGLAVELRRA